MAPCLRSVLAGRYLRDSAVASRINRTASGTPPSQAGPCPGSTQVASTPSIRSSDATACAGSSVNGAGLGPVTPVRTLRVVIASPANSASTAGTCTATLPGVCPGGVDDPRRAGHVEHAAVGDSAQLSGRSFDRSIVTAKVPKITVHGTRKTCGSLLAAMEVHPRVAMQILRHSKIAVTMEIYTEVPSAATRDALKKLGQWLGS